MDYEKLYEDEAFELEKLIADKMALERDIAKKRRFLVGLARMLGKDPILADLPTSLTLMCTESLRHADRPMNPSELVEHMKSFGYSFSDYKNPIPPVTTTLKRLVKAGKVRMKTVAGKKVYSIAK